jgi:hypothetical protein
MSVRGRTSCLIGLCLWLAACASIGPPEPPSLELPKPPSDLHARRKGDEVILTWTVPSLTTDRQKVRSIGRTLICRSLDQVIRDQVIRECGVPVGKSEPEVTSRNQPSGKSSAQKNSATYSDVLSGTLETDNPLGVVTYAVEVLNSSGRSAGLSNQVRVPLAPTLPPPRDFRADLSPAGVVLTWQAETTGETVAPAARESLRYVYRVYRRPEAGKQILAGEVPATAGPNFALTDSSIEWEQNYYYRAEAVTVIAQPGKAEVQIEGEDTSDVTIFTHDTFPPAVPSGLQAAFSGPGEQTFIDLVWAPVTDADLAGYNLYRREEGTGPVKLNGETLKTSAYRDGNVVSRKNYLYSVSAVDVHGNESARSEETEERVP